MAEINGEIEGTRFAHSVSVYDPETGLITGSIGDGGMTPAADVADITPAADGTTAGTALNALLASLRAAGILV